jgi:hypothetical protein
MTFDHVDGGQASVKPHPIATRSAAVPTMP